MITNSHRWMLVVALAQLSGPAKAQTDSTGSRRGPYAVVLTVGSGLSCYSALLKVPPGLERVAVRRFGVPTTFRAMWHPDHRLRVGVETGWTTLSSYRGLASGERARVYVSAVPMLLVFSMPLAWLSGTERSLARRLSVSGGTGVFVINSRLHYAGTVTSSRPSLGWMLAGSNTQPITR